VNRILELRPIVFVGLISYSLYLWHWPVIVLSQYYLVRTFTPPETAAALILMAACAILSWRYVERPFRNKTVPIWKVRIATGIGVVCLATAAAGLLWAVGLPNRLGAEAATINQAVDTNYRCPIPDYLDFGGSRACVLNLPSRKPEDADVVLLGNSHAQMYAPVWASILIERGQTGLLVPANGCLPTVQANISRECIDVAQRNLEQILTLKRARTVIVGLNWWHEQNALIDQRGRHADNNDSKALVTALDDLIDRLRVAGKQVIIIGPIAEPGWDVASILSRQLAFGHPPDRATFLPVTAFTRRFGSAVRHFGARPDIGFVRPDRVQCPVDRCYYVLDGRSLFSDSSHIAAAELPRFRAGFAAALAPTAAQ
jgi:hypothetical protein